MWSDSHESTPDRPSAQLNETVTLMLFHPYEFAAGEADPVIVGFVLSISTSKLGVTTLPASSAVATWSVWSPSEVSVWSAGHP